MNATLFKEVNYSLSKLIEDIDAGEIGLPDIQRPFVWTRAKVRDLFDSMYSGFPVGYLLFWGNVGTSGGRQIGTSDKQSVPRLLIVDGQQRLTSLYAVLKGHAVVDDDYKTEHIKIAFRPRDAYFSVPDAAVENDPEFISDISQLWVGPVSRNRFVRQFLEQLSKSRELSEDEEDHLTEAIDRLYDLQSYPFTALELSSTIDEEKVADVFVRINSKGVTLNQADFILTLMSVWWDEGRKDLEAFSRDSRLPSSGPSPYNHFIQPDPDQMLRVAVGLEFRLGRLRAVYSLLRGRDPETGQSTPQQRDDQFARLQSAQAYTLDLTNWHEFLKVLIRAGYCSAKMISSKNALLYAYVLYLIGKRDFKVPSEPLREVIARWFFMAALTGRYSSSPESQIESDLARLRGSNSAEHFTSTLDGIINDTLTADFWQITLPNALATSAARSPSLFAYYAALNLLDARVLLSSMKVRELLDPALKAKKSALERHHLFPRAHLEALGFSSRRDLNQVANFALVEWPKNNAIAANNPADYWPAYSQAFGAAELQRMEFWHALPPGWQQMRYTDFLTARRRMLANVVRAGYERLAGSDDAEEHEEHIAAVVAGGENALVEFKSAARYNQHTQASDPRIELTIIKTIAGFANAKGGTLVIGVNDDGNALGLEHDLALMKKPDLDRYQLWLTDLLENTIGKPAASAIDVAFPKLDGHTVCRVGVRPAISPVFVKPPGGANSTDFYVRVGNSTRQFTAAELLDYQKSRWG